jgi:hypothetical protein
MQECREETQTNKNTTTWVDTKLFRRPYPSGGASWRARTNTKSLVKIVYWYNEETFGWVDGFRRRPPPGVELLHGCHAMRAFFSWRRYGAWDYRTSMLRLMADLREIAEEEGRPAARTNDKRRSRTRRWDQALELGLQLLVAVGGQSDEINAVTSRKLDLLRSILIAWISSHPT